MRTPALLFAVIMVATIVQAASVTLTPNSIYETTTVWEELNVNNYQGSSVIEEVTVNSPTIEITDAKTYSGWTKTQDADTAEWKDGSIETNVKSAAFEFEVEAPTVTNDTAHTLTIKLDGTSSTVTLTVLNDATPPTITNVKPAAYAKANNPMQAISVNATDAETAVESVTYTWNDCAGGPDITTTLVKSGDTYNGVANFTGFDEGEKACYTVKATNTPGETSNTSGELLFDGTAPTTSIISPTTYATETTTFKFTASDNIATTLSCDVALDGTLLATVSAPNATETTTTKDLSNFTEGSYTWSVTCQDGVGLSATHAQAIQLDTAPPIVTITAPATLPRTQSVEITAKVVDTIAVGTVEATYDGSTVTLTQTGDDYKGTISSTTLGSKTLEVKAKDAAGHETIKTQTITIVPNHQITLDLSPSSVNPGDSVTASGTLTPEGNFTSTTVEVKTPSGDFTESLAGNDYSTTFTAPSAGTYLITVEYLEAGHVYTATATLTVTSSGSTGGDTSSSSSSGWGSDWNGLPGYVKPDEPPQTDSSNSNQQTEPSASEQITPTPAPYEPLPAEEPREALTPKATGIFDLGSTIKWIALLLALGLLGVLGAYAYSKRKPKDGSGIDWNGYFKNP